jgi:D-glycero-D-manno-heptose 1,7-bisphosphate phosphatase
LRKLFGKVFVVTNQRGIARKIMTESDLALVHQKMNLELSKISAPPDKIYYCPHDKNSCECRKPAIGMGLQAKKEFPEIDFLKSFMVGDSESDLKFGKNLGMKTIQVGEEPIEKSLIDYSFNDFIMIVQNSI